MAEIAYGIRILEQAIMKKDVEILALLERLRAAESRWTVVDHWEGDRCSIGFGSQSNPSVLVYVTTFGKARGYFDYDCEIISDSGLPQSVRKGQDVDFVELRRTMQEHLDTPNDGAE